MHHRGEQVQLADHALKGADLLLSGLLSIDLRLKPCRTPAQVSDARLKLWLLNQPLGIAVDQATDRAARFGKLTGESIKLWLARMCLHRVQPPLIFLDYERGVFQQPTNLRPHGIIERLNRKQPRIATELTMKAAAIGATASIVAPLPPMVVTAKPISARLAYKQTTQQVLNARQPLAIGFSVLLHTLCGAREELLVNDGRHCHADVPLSWCGNLSIGALWHAGMTARRMQRRLPRQALAAAIDGLTDIGRVEQHRMDHSPAPVLVPGRAWDALTEQAPANGSEGQALVPDPGENLADDPGCILVDFVTGSTSTSLSGDIAIAERGAREDADSPHLSSVALPAPAALEHLGPLVLSEHALKLQQQAVLRGVPDRAIEEDYLRAGSREFLQQQHLMRVAAGEAIRGMNIDDINCREGDEVTQALQGRSDQTGPAVAVVDEQHVLADLTTVLQRPCLQLGDLAVDGVALSLLIRRAPSVDRPLPVGWRRSHSQMLNCHSELLSQAALPVRLATVTGRVAAEGAHRRAPGRRDCPVPPQSRSQD